ncbi:SDR family oxidoreductase [Bradyrhizobium diazoefficiens]|uniref:Blr5976 protein n=2 Tax=Bradyrhizobium diazoefficiens TaxID=1355477 RepID=Q89HL4_BRADU|nr:SDR family oxidoreductase [Bradyrhizobium diazoefficiens]MBP1091235.1 NAD(P)-dependent dehydrogenase (short-subunit alcohol dehydrogenase family) [Bradyrhizobium japonicum]AND91118.1 oxidoreductase [Bradyrhizobium diazoefficiens USDA 110]QBP24741.1 SDR family oxidoreductase [Bradyrhizobium diazoefficiens]QLD42287.1 SDR family oxidoreductase [Bradyrhizobium diazoefficiens]WLB36148.1 SDR family oxidoreductase [Bradyrhizobium diazoefficiens]
MASPSSRYDLTGRTALVTGAGGLLGRQHVAALSEAGARVIVTEIGLAQAEAAVAALKQSTPSADLIALALDVTAQDSVRAANEQLASRGVTVDILVNNAAIDPKVTSSPGVMHSSRFEAFPVPQWQTEIAVGLTGAMLCAQEFGGQMAKRGRGVILNIASDLGVIAPDQRLYRQPHVTREEEQPVKPVTYSVIKHGLIGLTKYLATYWADHGVRVNAISPGGVFNNQDPAFVERLTRLIPMGRMAEVDEYRAAVQFLCSDASSYMTGQNLVMDGGRSVW